jgi:hypothetical protein
LKVKNCKVALPDARPPHPVEACCRPGITGHKLLIARLLPRQREVWYCA